MIWGYEKGTGGKPPVPIKLDVTDYCHALITGSSGSGKSYSVLYLLGELLKENNRISPVFCDFKNSKDFEFLKNYRNYYAGDDCYQGVVRFYEDFCKCRKGEQTNKRSVLIFDEYPAFINYLTMKDKNDKTKMANEIISIIAEILMLGRGIQYGVWIVTQRADASLFANGARDNFMVILSLGRLSKEQKGMVFAGEEIPNRPFKRGEGVMLADGYDLKEIIIPHIKSTIGWKRHICDCLSISRRPVP